MKNRKTSVSLFLTFLVVIGSTAVSLAQILPPPPTSSGAPLDPLSWLLLAAGGAFAGKKYLDRRSKDKH